MRSPQSHPKVPAMAAHWPPGLHDTGDLVRKLASRIPAYGPPKACPRGKNRLSQMLGPHMHKDICQAGRHVPWPELQTAAICSVQCLLKPPKTSRYHRSRMIASADQTQGLLVDSSVCCCNAVSRICRHSTAPSVCACEGQAEVLSLSLKEETQFFFETARPHAICHETRKMTNSDS